MQRNLLLPEPPAFPVQAQVDLAAVRPQVATQVVLLLAPPADLQAPLQAFQADSQAALQVVVVFLAHQVILTFLLRVYQYAAYVEKLQRLGTIIAFIVIPVSGRTLILTLEVSKCKHRFRISCTCAPKAGIPKLREKLP